MCGGTASQSPAAVDTQHWCVTADSAAAATSWVSSRGAKDDRGKGRYGAAAAARCSIEALRPDRRCIFSTCSTTDAPAMQHHDRRSSSGCRTVDLSQFRFTCSVDHYCCCCCDEQQSRPR